MKNRVSLLFVFIATSISPGCRQRPRRRRSTQKPTNIMNYRILKCTVPANLLAAAGIIPAVAQTLPVTNALQPSFQAHAGPTAGAGGQRTAGQGQTGTVHKYSH